jgi:hypothetical protein
MTSYVIVQKSSPKYRLVKYLVQNPDGKGGWVTSSSNEVFDHPTVLQVHGGQRIIIEEIDLDDRRMSPQMLKPADPQGVE